MDNEKKQVEEKGVEGTATPAVENQENVTKIVSERIKKTREKDRAELAKAMGFDSWEALLNSGVDKKLLDAGIDPEVGKPVINDIVENHPEVRRAKEILAEAENIKRTAELQQLNAKYGTSFKSFDELDEETKDLISKGVPISKAYIATHFEELKAARAETDPVKIAAAQKQQSLLHMKTIPGGGTPPPTSNIVVTQADIDNVRRYMPSASMEQIKSFIEKHPGIKL